MRKIAKNIISVCGHIGTHKYNWQPESERFAIGYRSSVLIYNVAMTNFYFNRACFFVENLVYKYGRIYIYGLDKKNDKNFIKKLENLNQVVTTHNWSGGFVTNARIFRGKIKNIRKKFAAILGLSYDYRNYSLPREAKIINLPSIGVVDSNANAETFTYPIPINSNNFGVTRLLTYVFTIKIFKGISKRILTRFKKKIKIVKSRKLNRKRKKKYILRIYFKKLKRKLKLKKKKLKRKLKNWSKKYKQKYLEFKSKRITLTERKKKNDYIQKNGQNWLTIEAALRRYAEIEKVRKLPKRKIKKFIQKKLLLKQKSKFKLPKTNDRKVHRPQIEKFSERSKKKKINSYIRIKTKLKQKRILRKQRPKNIESNTLIKFSRKKELKKNKKKKYGRYRPNKKWKFKPNRFRFKKSRNKFISRFSKLKKKISKLAKFRNFKKIITKEKRLKNPRFIYRFLKRAISKYKLKKIYKFLYKKKKKIILKKKKINKNYKYSKQRGVGKKSNPFSSYYKGNNYNSPAKANNNNQNNYPQKYRDNTKPRTNVQNKRNRDYSIKNNQYSAKDKKEKYRYYYKDFNIVKKPIKKKKYY